MSIRPRTFLRWVAVVVVAAFGSACTVGVRHHVNIAPEKEECGETCRNAVTDHGLLARCFAKECGGTEAKGPCTQPAYSCTEYMEESNAPTYALLGVAAMVVVAVLVYSMSSTRSSAYQGGIKM